MADIFVSYASADRAKAEELARILIAKGWSVFWDRDIPAGRRFHDVIESELGDSRCVIVLWSRQSVRSHWVRDEAEEARKLEKFLPVLIDGTAPPLGFRGYQNVDLTDWSTGSAHSGITRLLAEVRSVAPLAAAAYKRETAPLPSSSGDLFPLYGVTLGKTTVDEIARLGERTPSIDKDTGEPYKCYRVQGYSFWYDEKTNIVNSIYTTRLESMPAKWAELGFSWEKSYTEWCETLRSLGFSVEEQPDLSSIFKRLTPAHRISSTSSPLISHPETLSANPLPSPEFLLSPEFLAGKSKPMRAEPFKKKQADPQIVNPLLLGHLGLPTETSLQPEKSTTTRKATARRLVGIPLEIKLDFDFVTDDKLYSIDVKAT